MKPATKLLSAFRLPSAMSTELRRDLASDARVVTLDAGARYLQSGVNVEVFALVTEGLLRVFKTDESGREITLYTVGPGECCMINVLCLLSDRPSVAEAVVEEPVQALVYPGNRFRSWMATEDSMRSFIFGQLSDRIDGMMALIEEVAFQKMDRRLATHLLDRAERGDSSEIRTTHEALAADLGTAREVVSRLLKSFERKGAVSLGRGCIRILDAGALGESGC